MRGWLRSIDWLPISISVLALLILLVALPATLGNQQPSESTGYHSVKTECFQSGVRVECPNWLVRNKDTIEAASAITLALFTIALFWSTYGLWDATGTTINDARKSSERELRAYVGVERLDFRVTSQVKGYVPIDPTASNTTYPDYLVVKVKNYGQTPAKNVETKTVVVTGPFLFTLPQGFNYDSFIEQPSTLNNVVTEGFLSKDQPEEVTIPIPDANIVWDARLKNVTIIVFGRIYYRDIFNSSWSTKFCQIWEPWFPLGERFVGSNEFNGEDQRQAPK